MTRRRPDYQSFLSVLVTGALVAAGFHHLSPERVSGSWIGGGSPLAATPPGPAGPAPPSWLRHGEGRVLGTVTFEGRPVSEVTDLSPRFWMRDERTGKQVPAEVRYDPHSGGFAVEGLPPGEYYLSARLDTEGMNPLPYAGDLAGGARLRTADAPWDVEVREVLHLLAPEDNSGPFPRRARSECEGGGFRTTGPVRVRWERPRLVRSRDLTYRVMVVRLACPYRRKGLVASRQTTETEVLLDLPPTREGEFYLMNVEALAGRRRVASLITHGRNFLAWDYRFRVD